MFANEEAFILPVLKQSPIVGALILMIWYFLKFLKDEAVRRERLDEARTQALTTLGANCHQFQRDLASDNKEVMDKVAKSMDRNTEALGANTEMLGRVSEMIARLESERPHPQPQTKKKPPT